jgi:hypothetical protein
MRTKPKKLVSGINRFEWEHGLTSREGSHRAWKKGLVLSGNFPERQVVSIRSGQRMVTRFQRRNSMESHS